MSQRLENNRRTIDQFRSYLYLLARSHLGTRLQPRIDASDLVQQTLLDACAKSKQFRGTTDAERAAWLRQILTHNLQDALRHNDRGKRDLSRQQPLEVGIDKSFCRAQSWLEAHQTSPSQHAARKEDPAVSATGRIVSDGFHVRRTSPISGLCPRDDV